MVSALGGSGRVVPFSTDPEHADEYEPNEFGETNGILELGRNS
jgi:hypothetical protein